MHAQWIGAGAIDLVDDDDGRPTQCQCLAQYEARLRHRTVERIDHEQHTIDHAENALDFTTEISVSRRVDDIYFCVLPADGRVFCENGDAALFFERVRIHDAVFHDLIVAECTGLAEHLVDESGLPVVDMGDDGDVANLHSLKR